VYAIELARKIDARFSFRFVSARDQFAAIRQIHPNHALSDVECFVEFIEEKLSTQGRKVWQRAKARQTRYRELFDTVMKRAKGKFENMTPAQLQAGALKAIVEYELKSNKHDPSWSFSGGGIERLTDDFFLLNEYIEGFSGDRLQRWSTEWGKYIVPADLVNEINAIPDEKERTKKMSEAIAPFVEPLNSFFAALCHALQEGENELTAEDAYWLGLIDEVVGRDDLLCLRYFEEFRPDPAPDEKETKGEKVEATGP
jgi:hypothetical protein